jgi:cell division protein FtsW
VSTPSADLPPPRRPPAITPATIIFVCVAALLAIGLAVLFSAATMAKGGPYAYLFKQIVFMSLATGLGGAVALADLEQKRHLAVIVAAVAVAGLVLVLIPGLGIKVNGSRRWLGVPGAALQVSELAKLALVFLLAHYLARNQSRLHTFVDGALVPTAIIGVFVALILKEPDLGMATLTWMIGMAMLGLAGVKLLHLLPFNIAALAGAFFYVLHDAERWSRITAPYNLDRPEVREGPGYQLWQALLAFASGGLGGVGIGSGRQQLAFLPEAHTDCIYAVLGEELGLGFTLLVVALFTTIFVAGLFHVRRAPNLFQFLLVTGCVLLITLQALINLGVVTGLLPTKGMSLPFISAGGSNLLLMGLLVGIIINSQRTWARPAPLQRRRTLTEVAA